MKNLLNVFPQADCVTTWTLRSTDPVDAEYVQRQATSDYGEVEVLHWFQKGKKVTVVWKRVKKLVFVSQ